MTWSGDGAKETPPSARSRGEVRVGRALPRIALLVAGSCRDPGAPPPGHGDAGWHLGGKTGTGPDRVGPTSDGWFAGLVFEGERARYTAAVFVEGRGPGGGVAAGMAADMARFLAGLDG